MYRKKVIKDIDVKLLNDILIDVKHHFQQSSAPNYLKRLTLKINPIFTVVNRPHSLIYGCAYAISTSSRNFAIKKRLNLKREHHPSIDIDDQSYFLIIEINKPLLKRVTKRGLRYLIAHEFAHLIQIINDQEVDGRQSLSTPLDHDIIWKQLCKWSGGTGSDLIPFKEIYI